uniref:DUF1618 domain-containing protein n=1 Tax=Arundo donax TaxID=35708 RepID=A0A0A9A0E9_ARUDO
MGFVDLWRGILFCDVLPAEGKPIPPLRYVKLPPPFQPSEYSDDARLTRDIAVVQEGRMIKYVALQLHWKPCPGFKDHYVVDGWVSRAWNRPVAASYLEDCWDLDCTCKSSAITVDSNQHFELLPKVLDNGGTPLSPFNKLFICQPTLSLHDNDGIVYFMTKKNRWDHKAWVIAVDMRKNTLRGVAEFSAERFVGMNFAYVHSRISKFLLRAPGTMKDLKRSGTELLGSSVKKHAGFWMSMPPWDLGQKKHDSEMEGDGDDMV